MNIWWEFDGGKGWKYWEWRSLTSTELKYLVPHHFCFFRFCFFLRWMRHSHNSAFTLNLHSLFPGNVITIIFLLSFTPLLLSSWQEHQSEDQRNIVTLECLRITNFSESSKGPFSYCFCTCEVMEKSKIKNRMHFAFPDLLDISAKKKPQMEACWSSAASLLVLWEGALEGKTILECSGILIIPTIILLGGELFGELSWN